MWARVSSYQGPPENLDEDIRYTVEEILPRARQLTGYLGVYALGDRTTGASMSITLWQDEATLRASEEAANRLRQESADHADETIVDVARFEVLFHEHT